MSSCNTFTLPCITWHPNFQTSLFYFKPSNLVVKIAKIIYSAVKFGINFSTKKLQLQQKRFWLKIYTISLLKCYFNFKVSIPARGTLEKPELSSLPFRVKSEQKIQLKLENRGVVNYRKFLSDIFQWNTICVGINDN